MNEVVILYHKNCLDGFTAAWAAWKYFGDSAEYIPVAHQSEPPENFENKTIYFVDFVYPRDILQDIINKNTSVTVIDHHETSKDYVDIADDHLFDMNHSGAVLTWQYFHPDKPVPKLLQYVEDVDIWKFDMDNTEEVVAFLEIKDREFSEWNQLAEEFEDESALKENIKVGKLLLDHKDRIISQIGAKADLVEFEGHKTLAVNSPVFASELGHHLYEKYPPLAIIWYEFREKVKVSLRSDGSVNVGKIAEKFGGGGHPGSAAFKFSAYEDFPWEVIND